MSKSQNLTNIGHNQAVATKLYKFLADSYATLITTQALHWNVEGEEFYSIHKLTDDIYNEQFTAIDEIAERLRAIGSKVDASFAAFSSTTTVKTKPTLEAVIAAQEEAANSAQAVIDIAEEEEDKGTADLATRRIQAHQKNIWMLKSQSK